MTLARTIRGINKTKSTSARDAPIGLAKALQRIFSRMLARPSNFLAGSAGGLIRANSGNIFDEATGSCRPPERRQLWLASEVLHWRRPNRIVGKSRLLCTIDRAGQVERTSRAASAMRVNIVRTEREAEIA